MYLEIVTPEASLVQGEVSSVSVPGRTAHSRCWKITRLLYQLGAGEVKFKGNPEIAEAHKSKFTQKDGVCLWP